MIRGLIDEEQRGAVLADLARGVMRSKIMDLSLAPEGRFVNHHALMCHPAPGTHRPPDRDGASQARRSTIVCVYHDGL
jgi:hypothetical protein